MPRSRSPNTFGRHLAAAFRGQDLLVTYRVTPVPGGIPLDIDDHAKVSTVIAESKPDVILLAAAEPHVERCEREPEATRAINVEAPRAIAEAARRVPLTI